MDADLEVVDQYPGGAEQRAGDIEAGAGRTAAELRADLVASAERIDVAVAAMDERAWDGQSRNTAGSLQRSRDLVAPRWREIEVHHVDLGLGYEPDEWPAEFVERLLPAALADVGRRLPGLDRIDPATVLAWTFGRVDPPAGLPRLLPY